MDLSIVEKYLDFELTFTGRNYWLTIYNKQTEPDETYSEEINIELTKEEYEMLKYEMLKKKEAPNEIHQNNRWSNYR